MAMTRKEVLEQYEIRDGVIRSPGKFEAEPIYLPALWESTLEGGADEEVGDPDTGGDTYIYIVRVNAEDRAEFPELKGVHAVAMWETDNGFVNKKEFDSEGALKRALEQNEKQLEKKDDSDDFGSASTNWEVVVGNVGTVYSGDSEKEARKTYREYAKMSKQGSGRAGGESVVLMKNGDIKAELQDSGGDDFGDCSGSAICRKD